MEIVSETELDLLLHFLDQSIRLKRISKLCLTTTFNWSITKCDLVLCNDHLRISAPYYCYLCYQFLFGSNKLSFVNALDT